ncbi:MAG: dehydrogenase [Prevotellaceae bacterium]|nr:dehydrogenase [Prevotellaceae bacterium]
MADNFLEKHQLEYEKRKEEWLRKKKHLPKRINNAVNNHNK